jgi:hypothetical protein
VLIVPCHAGYVVKQAAQEHAMAHTGVLQSASQRSFNTAMRVQQSQRGLIQRGSYRMLIVAHAAAGRDIGSLELEKTGGPAPPARAIEPGGTLVHSDQCSINSKS